MPKPNYSFEKRQRELKKTKQQEEKRLKKLSRTDSGQPADGADAGSDGTTAAPGDTPATSESAS